MLIMLLYFSQPDQTFSTETSRQQLKLGSFWRHVMM